MENVSSSPLEMNDNEYKKFQEIILDHTGINMSDSKKLMVQRRLSTRLKKANLKSYSEYLTYLKTAGPDEIEAFNNAVTTNLTAFFRENHHFDFLKNTILSNIEKNKKNKHLRIWSAGCSTGEEPYCISMILQEAINSLGSWNAKILATDIDSNVLATCKEGVYREKTVQSISESRLKKWFIKNDAPQSLYTVSSNLKKLITFNQLNLMDDWPMKGKFDVIFCRNVIIYFDKKTQAALIERYANLLEDGGYLILGHSESISHNTRFSLDGNTIYRKIH